MLRLLQAKIKSFKTSLAKKILDKKISKSNTTLTISEIKSILFLRTDNKIGDTVVSSFLYRQVKKKYPNIKIIVLCGRSNKEIFKYNKNVDEIYEVGSCLFNDISIFKNLRKQNISLVIDFFPFNPRFKHLLMLRISSPEFLIGFNKAFYKMYDLSVNEDFFSVHITNMYKYILNLLKIDSFNLKYEIPFSSKEENPALELINNYKYKYKIVINPFSESKHRRLSIKKLKELIYLIIKNIFDCCVFILCQEKNKEEVISLESDKTIIASFKSILESAALIKYTDIVITPDTSIVHIAAAFDKKTIALYRDYSNSHEKTDIIWAPNNPNAIQLSVDTKCVLSNDVENIPNVEIINALKKIL
jgi:ADP-heptose:LPS heptosyltransferase